VLVLKRLVLVAGAVVFGGFSLVTPAMATEVPAVVSPAPVPPGWPDTQASVVPGALGSPGSIAVPTAVEA
jgi:hypothetical protein